MRFYTYLPAHRSPCLHTCMHTSLHTYACANLHPLRVPEAHTSISMPIFMSLHMSILISTQMRVHTPVHMPMHMSTRTSIHLPTNVPIHASFTHVYTLTCAQDLFLYTDARVGTFVFACIIIRVAMQMLLYSCCYILVVIYSLLYSRCCIVAVTLVVDPCPRTCCCPSFFSSILTCVWTCV